MSFGTSLPKERILRVKKLISLLNPSSSNRLGTKFQLKLTVFIFWSKYGEKRLSVIETGLSDFHKMRENADQNNSKYAHFLRSC